MRITVNGVSLWFDVDGSGLVADGPQMRARPTLLLVHGGPGADHSLFKPDFGQLSDIAQVVYLDLRGNGRSDDGPPELWSLAQWGDDIRAFCEALGIERPIVFGGSFGGFVAQSYATRHPDHPAALILANTTARADFEVIYEAFGRIGGPEAEAAARAYWGNPTAESRAAYFETCLPHYGVEPAPPDMMQRLIVKNPVALAFNGPKNEQGAFDFRADLAAVTCPCLVISGDRDPIMPEVFSDQIERCLTAAPVTRLRLEDCGHLSSSDQPDAFFAALRRFILDQDLP